MQRQCSADTHAERTLELDLVFREYQRDGVIDTCEQGDLLARIGYVWWDAESVAKDVRRGIRVLRGGKADAEMRAEDREHQRIGRERGYLAGTNESGPTSQDEAA